MEIIKYYEDGSIRIRMTEQPDECAMKTSYYKNGSVNHKEWCMNGQYHREDGPADMWYGADIYSPASTYYLNGKKMLSIDAFMLERRRIVIDRILDQM